MLSCYMGDYGTKSAEFEAKVAHGTVLWDNICGKPSQSVS